MKELASNLQRIIASPLVAVFTIGVLSVCSFVNLLSIPFHPDESTNLFMSADFDLLITDPFSLGWDAVDRLSSRHTYRLLDAPLTRYVLGLGRSIRGLPALPVDWDWSKTWDENVRNQAFPGSELLLVGRVAITTLLPFSLVFIYKAGKRIGNPSTGLLAAVFLGTSGLILLHSRRAMAEGPLIFAIAMSLCSFFDGAQRPWLAGVAAALALSAKQSAFVFIPVGLISVVWIFPKESYIWRKIVFNAIQYLFSFIIFSLALNPVFWKTPVATLAASWQARQELLLRQVSDIKEIAPEKILDSSGERLAVLTGNLFIAPLSFGEVGNYVANTQEAETSYLGNPLNNLWRGFLAGGINLFLTLLGIFLSLIYFWRGTPDQRRSLGLLLCGTIFQLIALIAFVPLPWQRYTIPLVPFASLWAALGVSSLLRPGLVQNHN